MTWEETIIFIRQKKEFGELVENTYLDADLRKNIEKFKSSLEFTETLQRLRRHLNSGTPSKNIRILDIGAGNGISSVAFALHDFQVTAIEPDTSDTIGCGAIQFLKSAYHLQNLDIISSYGESLPFEEESFDVVYARQAMHHAKDLSLFVKEASRVLKKGGLMYTCRDHVVNDAQQKKEFLSKHPLQHFYEGENAFSLTEYTTAFKQAGLSVLEELGPLDSAINYNPKTTQELLTEFRTILKRKMPLSIPKVPLFDKLIFKFFKWRTHNLYHEAGRLYTFIAKKSINHL